MIKQNYLHLTKILDSSAKPSFSCAYL